MWLVMKGEVTERDRVATASACGTTFCVQRCQGTSSGAGSAVKGWGGPKWKGRGKQNALLQPSSPSASSPVSADHRDSTDKEKAFPNRDTDKHVEEGGVKSHSAFPEDREQLTVFACMHTELGLYAAPHLSQPESAAVIVTLYRSRL